MIRVYIMRTCLALALAAVSGVSLAGDFEPIGERLGGDAGRPAFGQNAFALPAPNLNGKELRDFAFGNRLFNTNWVIAGASTTKFDGLGPLFNRVSCSACHVRDGRGRPPLEDGLMDSMLVRISVPDPLATDSPRAHPVYGDQIQDRSIPGVDPEARIVIEWEETAGEYADGETYSLRRPVVTIADAAYGPLPENLKMSPRVAQGMVGLGLLEAISEKSILALADPQDDNGDGVSGRPNLVLDVESQKQVIGRFGWKANQPSLRQQVAGAAAGDIGITSSIFPEDGCTSAQKTCKTSPNGGKPELSDSFLDRLVLYTQTLAVPHRRDADDPRSARGELLFHEAGCAACHVPTFQTGEHELAALSNQTIHPFTDLLLHDMGPGLADNRPDFKANGQEWRTSPLWGLGLIPTVNDHDLLLHDGRARGIAEAILWHGGEGEVARERFRHMSELDREALIKFLQSL